MPPCKNLNAKITLIEKFLESGNLRANARELNSQRCQLRNWGKNYSKIKELAEQSPNKLTYHPGKKVKASFTGSKRDFNRAT